MKKITFWLLVLATLVLIAFVPLAGGCKAPLKPDGTVDTVKQCRQEVQAMQIALTVARTAALALFGPDPVVQGLITSAQKSMAEASAMCDTGDATGFDVALAAFSQALAALASYDLIDTSVSSPAARDGTWVMPDFRESASILEGRRLQKEQALP